MCVSGGRLCGLRKQLPCGQAVGGERRMRSDLFSWTEHRAAPSPVSHTTFATNPVVGFIKAKSDAARQVGPWPLGVGCLNPLTWDPPQDRPPISVLDMYMNKGWKRLCQTLKPKRRKNKSEETILQPCHLFNTSIGLNGRLSPILWTSCQLRTFPATVRGHRAEQ